MSERGTIRMPSSFEFQKRREIAWDMHRRHLCRSKILCEFFRVGAVAEVLENIRPFVALNQMPPAAEIEIVEKRIEPDLFPGHSSELDEAVVSQPRPALQFFPARLNW